MKIASNLYSVEVMNVGTYFVLATNEKEAIDIARAQISKGLVYSPTACIATEIADVVHPEPLSVGLLAYRDEGVTPMTPVYGAAVYPRPFKLQPQV